MSEILKINNLWGGYQDGVDILRGISLEVQQGEAVGIIGLNGSGKSTFGKAIMNMVPFRKGEIFFEGEDITSLTTSQLSHRGISIMQQGGKVFPNLSVWDNMQLASQGDDFSIADIIPLLQKSKKELQNMMADKLSGGQKHQLSLAMTLASNPRLVILDEPSAGLSPKAVEEMYKILQAIREFMGVTIILIEQNISRALGYCERSLLMEMGEFSSQIESSDFNRIEELLFKNIKK